MLPVEDSFADLDLTESGFQARRYCKAEGRRQMYTEIGEDGRRRYIVQQIADDLGVACITVCGHFG
ncbi:hypothetical protein ACFQ6V_22360 [Streptomyces roseifaciens]